MQPDEETGSAEEQPASNMAAQKLETVEYRSRPLWNGFCIQLSPVLAQYVLIGTFTSFTIAILFGFGVDWLTGLNFE